MQLGLSLAADAVWILVMALIASSSRAAMQRIAADVAVPMQFSLKGEVNWRAPRNIAFGVMIGVPLVLGLILLVVGRRAEPQDFLLIFLVRMTAAPLLAVVHLAWLKVVLEVLAREGRLKP